MSPNKIQLILKAEKIIEVRFKRYPFKQKLESKKIKKLLEFIKLYGHDINNNRCFS